MIFLGKSFSVGTDGAKVMTGKLCTIARIKNFTKSSSSNHCILPRHALVIKKISASLRTVLEGAVQIIYYNKTHPLQTRIYLKALCEDSGKSSGNYSFIFRI